MRGSGFQAWRRKRRRRYKHQPGVVPWLLSLPPRFALLTLRLLPKRLALAIAVGLGRLVWLSPSRRRIALDHLAQAFPDLDEKERARIGLRSCGHFVRNLAEMLILGPNADPNDIERLATFDPGTRELYRAQKDEGAVFVQGHYGTMEVMDGLLGVLGLRLLTVVRLPYNHYVARALTKGREGWGVDLIRRDGALKKMRSRLEEGGSVMLPMDVNASKHGIFVEWFGRLASTEPAAAWLALRTGKPLIVCYGVRAPDARTWHTGARVVRPASEPVKPSDEDLHRVTRDIHRALEDAIRLRPEQYLWIHNRYRTRPS